MVVEVVEVVVVVAGNGGGSGSGITFISLLPLSSGSRLQYDWFKVLEDRT